MKLAFGVIVALAALGLVGGALSGLLGIGSGIIMVPVLSALWSKNPDAQKIAQGTALAVMVPMTIAGALSYHFGGQYDNFRISVPLVLWALLLGSLALMVPLYWSPLLGVRHALNFVRWDYVAYLALGGVLGSTFLGAPLAAELPSALLKKLFGLFIILVGLRMIGFYAWVGSLFLNKPTV